MEAALNAYGDTVISGTVPTAPEAFREGVGAILAGCQRGTWLTLPWDADHVHLLPIALQLGFTVHHAVDGTCASPCLAFPVRHTTRLTCAHTHKRDDAQVC